MGAVEAIDQRVGVGGLMVMKHKHILTVFFIISTFVLSMFAPRSIASNIGLTDQAALTYKKTEVVETKYSPFGELLSEAVKINFEVYNNNSLPAQVYIRDRVECVNPDTLAMLYNTPNPTRIESFGNTTLILWGDVTIQPQSYLKYQYMAETWRSIPIAINETIRINGNPKDPKLVGEIYALDANVSDTLTLQVTIRNVGQQLYTGRKLAAPITLCTVGASLSDYYFSDLKTSPKANSTSTIADRSLITWIMFLNDSVTLKLSAKVDAVDSWGTAPIEPITIQLTPVPEEMVTEVETKIKSLGDSVEMLEGFLDVLDGLNSLLGQLTPNASNYNSTLTMIGLTLKELSTNLTDALPQIDDPVARGIVASVRDRFSELGDKFLSPSADGVGQLLELSEEMSSMTIELKNEIEDLKDRKADLESLSIIISNQKTPYNVEVYSVGSQPNYGIGLVVEEYMLENSSARAEWALTYIEITNKGSSSQAIDGLTLQATSDQTVLKPKYALLFVDGNWQEFYGDLLQLGLTYDATNNILYLWPKVEVKASGSSNILVDLAGRSIILIFECDEAPEFNYTIDIEQRFPNAQTEPVNGRTLCFVNQPYIFAKNFTLPEYVPPPSPPSAEKGWPQILFEYLQSPIILMVFSASLITLGFLYLKGRKAVPAKVTRSAKRIDVRELVREIDRVKKMIEDKDYD